MLVQQLETQEAERRNLVETVMVDEAREALIEHFGPAHCAYRVRIRRYPQPVPALPLPASAACR